MLFSLSFSSLLFFLKIQINKFFLKTQFLLSAGLRHFFRKLLLITLCIIGLGSQFHGVPIDEVDGSTESENPVFLHRGCVGEGGALVSLFPVYLAPFSPSLSLIPLPFYIFLVLHQRQPLSS